MSAEVREALASAQVNAADAYNEWVGATKEEADAWAELGYIVSFDVDKKSKLDTVVGLVRDNWGKITAISAAFGVPLAAADVGAFTGVLGKLASLWPF